ncbi:MAG: LamG domain-containing protein [Candidatus Verstraetearchaeota archaeon]|nr:LamG domain-containing protein [Candidatus Verstraetearchaeota archaeon]
MPIAPQNEYKRKTVLMRSRIILFSLIFVEFATLALSLTNTPPLIRAIFALPSFYIIPGAILLIALRGDVANFVKLTVEGFFLSTILSVMLTAVMLVLGLPLIPFNYSLTTLILVLSLSVIALIRKVEFKLRKSDGLLFTITLLSYVIMLVYFNGLPRLFTPDETSYIADIRDTVLKGNVPSWSSVFSSELIALLTGRIFWTLLGGSFLGATGLPSYQLNLLSNMFLPMIALTSSLLIPSNFKDRELLRTASLVLIVSNPILVEFSDFILNDLALSFYIVFAIALFIESFKIEDVGKTSIDFRSLALCFLSILIVILIKPNLLFLFPLYAIVIGFILKHKLHRIKKYKVVLFTLTIPLLAYELIIDIPYVFVVWWKFGSEPLRQAIWAFTKGFLALGSPAESFLGWFISTPWKDTTIFSYDYFGYSNYLYRFLSPEALSLLVAGLGLVLPTILLLKEIRNNLQTTLLILLTSIILILFFFTSLSSAIFWDINRYCLYIYPLITVASLIVFYVTFSEANVRKLVVLIVPSIFLLTTQASLLVGKGGVYIGYGLPKVNWTGAYLLLQLLIYLILVIITRNIIISFKLPLKRHFRVYLPKVLFSSLVALILSSNLYFAEVFVDQSTSFREVGLKDLDETLRGVNTSFILSNSYIYLRDFVSDDVYRNSYLLPPPMTKQELDYFISKGFNGSRIVVAEDPAIASYEYANAYKEELLGGGYILPRSDSLEAALPDPNVVGSDCVLNLVPNTDQNSFDDTSGYRNTGVAYNTLSIKDESGRNAIFFNGKNSFIEFEHNSALNITDTLSVRVWFRTSSTQQAKFILEKGDPYSYGIYLTTNSTILIFYVRLAKIGVVTANFKGTFADGRLYDAVGVFDGRYVKLYVNGLLRANVDTGVNDKIVASSKPLWIGTWAKGSFFNGTIYGVQIYNRALSSSEIQSPYLKDSSYAKPIYEAVSKEGKKTIVYQVEGPIKLHKSRSDISVNDLQVDVSNYLLPILRVNVTSPRVANLTIIVGTLRFSKILDAKLGAGGNTLEYPFEYKLPDGRSYGSYVASRCIVIIIDEEGNIVYDNTVGQSQLTKNELLPFTLLLGFIVVLYISLSLNRLNLPKVKNRYMV